MWDLVKKFPGLDSYTLACSSPNHLKISNTLSWCLRLHQTTSAKIICRSVKNRSTLHLSISITLKTTYSLYQQHSLLTNTIHRKNTVSDFWQICISHQVVTVARSQEKHQALLGFVKRWQSRIALLRHLTPTAFNIDESPHQDPLQRSWSKKTLHELLTNPT